MNKTKKGFLIAGGILAIIGAVFAIITGFSIAGLTIESIREGLLENAMYYTEEEFESYVALVYNLVQIVGYLTIVLSIINLVLGLLILVRTSNETITKKIIITELVFAILGGGMLTMAFMIAALCIKDKPDDTHDPIQTIEI